MATNIVPRGRVPAVRSRTPAVRNTSLVHQKYMGMVEEVQPKRLPAPAKAAAPKAVSGLRGFLSRSMGVIGLALTPSTLNKGEDELLAKARAKGATIDTSTIKPAAQAAAPKVTAPKAAAPKVVRVQTGAKGGTKTSAVSTGTTSVASKAAEGAEGSNPAGVTIKAQDNVQSVQGSGNIDEPKADPQFDAEIKNYEDYKAAGGDKNDLEGFSAWKKLKEKGQLNRIVRSGSGGMVRSGSGFLTSGE